MSTGGRQVAPDYIEKWVRDENFAYIPIAFEKYKIKREFPLLSQTYDPAIIISIFYNVYLDTINKSYFARIEAIEKRQGRLWEKKIAALEEQRERELRRFTTAMEKALLSLKPGRPSEKDEFLRTTGRVFSKLRAGGSVIDKPTVAQALGYSVRNMSYRMKNYGLRWKDLLELFDDKGKVITSHIPFL